MKIVFYLFLLINSIIAFSQRNSIIFQSKGAESVVRWLELNPFPFSQKPFVRIDSEIGKIIPLNEIDFIKGYDQNGNFIMLRVFQQNQGIQFTQWKHIENKTGNLNLYQDQLLFGLPNEFPQEMVREYYSYDTHDFKNLNFKNVKNDLKTSGITNSEIRQTKALIAIQRISQLIGISILANQIIDNTPNIGAEFMKNTNSGKFYLSACLIVMPISLDGIKKRLLRESLLDAYAHHKGDGR